MYREHEVFTNMYDHISLFAVLSLLRDAVQSGRLSLVNKWLKLNGISVPIAQ